MHVTELLTKPRNEVMHEIEGMHVEALFNFRERTLGEAGGVVSEARFDYLYDMCEYARKWTRQTLHGQVS